MSVRLLAAPQLRALGRQVCGTRPALRISPSGPSRCLPRTAPVATKPALLRSVRPVAFFQTVRPNAAKDAAVSANPAYSAPETDIKSDKLNGSYHWDFERALSVALIPLIGASAAYGAHPTTDLLLGVVLPLHSHIGFDACITDYVHSRKFPVLNKLCVWSLRAGTVLLLYACYEFNTNDVGLTEGLKKIWKA